MLKDIGEKDIVILSPRIFLGPEMLLDIADDAISGVACGLGGAIRIDFGDG